MASGVEVAQAYITIIPSMQGIQGQIAKELGAEKIGQKAGKDLGKGLKAGTAKSSEALMKSFNSVGDRIAFKTKTGLNTAFNKVADNAKTKMSGAASTISSKFKAVGDKIANSGIGKALTNAATVAKGAFDKVTGTIRGAAQFAGEAFRGVADKVGSALSPIADKVGPIFSAVSSAAKSAFSTMAVAAAAGAATVIGAIDGITVAAIANFSEYQQLAGGAKQIFNNLDFEKISADAQSAYKDLGMSANEYLESINQVGAAFKSSMGDEAGYDTAKRGMQAISNYASGTGRNLDELNEKYALITRSTSSYQSIADQFSGILPATSKDFLEQAKAAGVLKDSYQSLSDVPIAEYQQAVTAMMEKGVESLGLAGNTAREAATTISGSGQMLKASVQNLLTELAKDDGDVAARVSEVVDSALAVVSNVAPRIPVIVGALMDEVPKALQANAPKIASALTEVLDGVTNGGFSKAVAAVQPYADRMAAAASKLWDRLQPLAPVVQDIGGKIGSIFTTALGAATVAFEALAPVIATVAEHALPILDSALGAADTAFSTALTVMEPVASFLSDTLTVAIDFVGTQAENMANLVESAFTVVSDAIGSLADFISDPVGTITNLAKSAGDALFGAGETAAKGADNAAKSTEKGYGKAGKAITDSTSKAASNATRNMSNAASSVQKQSNSAASSAEKNGNRIKTAWDKSYTTKMNAEAHTSSAESQMSSFKNRWSGFNVNGYASVDTSGANSSLSSWISRASGFVVSGVAKITSKIGFATGGVIYQKHADGFIANKPGTGVDITRHIAGEAGAEAVIPLTNKRYVAPFAQTVADFINDDIGGVTIKDCTFNVRKETDITAIGRAINQEAERQRRAKL